MDQTEEKIERLIEKQIENTRVSIIEDETRRYQSLSYAIDISKGSNKINISSPEELINIADIIEKYLKEGKVFVNG